MNKQIYISVAFWILFNGELFAQSESINVTSTAVPFLQISSDVIANGMGGAGIATAPDGNAGYWNLGKLPFMEKKGTVNANYSPWLREWISDMYKASLAGSYKFNDNEAIHGLINYFNPGTLQFTDNNGNHLQSYHPNEFGISIGYSRKLSDKIGLGIGLKYIRSSLANGTQNGVDYKAGNAMAADLGFYYNLRNENNEGWAWGATLSNLGSKISYSSDASQKDFIPANLGIGTSYTKVFNEQNKISVALDVNKLLVPTPPNSGDPAALAAYRNKSVVGSWFSSFSDASGGIKEELKEYQVSIGAEYYYHDQYSLRAGYFYEDKIKGNRQYFTLGTGIQYSIISLNFSYLIPVGTIVSKSPLANTLQFGVAISFGK